MRTTWALAILLALGMAATPAMARHKHRRGCGHVYSQPHRGWVSVNVATRGFGFSFQSAPRHDRYDDRRYDDRGYYDRRYDGRYDRGYWDPYRYDSRYDRHRSYWRDHHGHRHGYRDRCR